MIIRQSASPRKDGNGGKSWPPKSPHEALLSSPSGRRKAQRLYDRSSTSPSPAKRKRPTLNDDLPVDQASEDEEDEETLQLKLQAIEARLKLKRLQKSKSKAIIVDQNGNRRTLSPDRRQGQTKHDARREATIQVPLSPLRSQKAPTSPKSPGRILLGIDKGLKATEISLKKPPARRYAPSASERIETERKDKNQKHQSSTKPKSFNERLADLRDQEADRKQREEKVLKSRSQGFGLAKASKAFQSNSDDPGSRRGMSTNEADTLRSASKIESHSSTLQMHKNEPRGQHTTNGELEFPKADDNSASCEPYSKFHLSKRILAAEALDNALEGKMLYSIPDLLKTVVAPTYDPPDVEGDYVVFGVIANKSSPYDKAAKHQTSSSGDQDEKVFGNRSKFMVLHLTDLKWEIDLFLFDTGFERFWKLTVGTVVAILNPFVMPPKPHMRDTGKFSLKLSSSDDTVLEIGTARDLGFCKSIKKDGQQCTQWIDLRHTEFCEFHVNLKVEKARAGRMEVNTMTDIYSDLPANKTNARGKNGSFFGRPGTKSGRGEGGRGFKDDGLTREGRYHDRFLNETVYLVPPGSGASTAKLFDDEDLIDRGMSKAERQRKRLAANEKERDLAKKLSATGGGMGAAYIRVKHSDAGSTKSLSSGNSTTAEPTQPMDAISLGLMGGNASAARLSPVKGRKGGTSSSADAVGWSAAFKRGVPSVKRDAISPSKEASEAKKARFMIEKKGIRVPGRDSIPGLDALDDADDDDLDIVRP